jgi:hypothetical protein
MIESPSSPAKRNQKWVDHTGQVFATAKAMAQAYGLSQSIVVKRLGDGWHIEKALTTEPRRYSHCIDTAGYGSIAEFCRAHGYSNAIYKWQRRKGWTHEQAVEYIVKPSKTR